MSFGRETENGSVCLLPLSSLLRHLKALQTLAVSHADGTAAHLCCPISAGRGALGHPNLFIAIKARPDGGRCSGSKPSFDFDHFLRRWWRRRATKLSKQPDHVRLD